MTYRCIPIPQHHRIVLMGPDNQVIHIYDDRYPAHMGTCRRYAEELSEQEGESYVYRNGAE